MEESEQTTMCDVNASLDMVGDEDEDLGSKTQEGAPSVAMKENPAPTPSAGEDPSTNQSTGGLVEKEGDKDDKLEMRVEEGKVLFIHYTENSHHI